MQISPAEYLELIQLAEDAAGFQAMNASAIIFAYVTAIYIVGHKLSRIKALALTFVYSALYIFPVSSVLTNIARAGRLNSNIAVEFPDIALSTLSSNIPSTEFYIYSSALVFFLCWLLSVAFMINEREMSS